MTPTHRTILETLHAHWPDGIRPDYATYEELAAMTNLRIDQIERAPGNQGGRALNDLHKSAIELLADAQRELERKDWEIRDLKRDLAEERDRHHRTAAAIAPGSTPSDRAVALVTQIYQEIKRAPEWLDADDCDTPRHVVVDMWAWHLTTWLQKGELP